MTNRSVAAAQRLKRERKAVAETEKREPLRRRILTALVNAAATPTELSERLGAPTPSISRLLKEFREAGLVATDGDAIDRRRVHYSLTVAGEVELSRHTAFGAREKPPAPFTDEQTIRLMRLALNRAVRIRREANRLGEAADRLRAVVRESEKVGAAELALEARVELAKTLRQEREPDDRHELDVAYEEQLEKLNDVALGNAGGYGAELALPAAAHLKYCLGRAGDRCGGDLPTRESHLVAACSLYGQLVTNSEDKVANSWLAWQAWSFISLAGNLRKQSQLERGLRWAALAKRSFDHLEDDYGRAHCLFMFGFCLRLLGEFREALTCLEQAHRIAEKGSFRRIQADSLMQMGEVRRCLGDLEQSRALLMDALVQSEQMHLWVTRAFAQSALGAVEFQCQNLSDADAFLARAEELFAHCQHAEGKALNSRRRAAVARRIAVESSRPNYIAVERLICSAHEGYSWLQSPAGIVACEIEDGRVRMLRKSKSVQPVVGRLSQYLANPGQCEIVELDPWVPRLLHNFALDVEDEPLVELSERVAEAAHRKLSERGRQGVELVAAVVDDVELEEEDELDPDAAEMGGESRRDPSAFEGLIGQGLLEREMQAA